MEYPSIPIGTTTTSYGITLVMTEDGWRADLQHTMMRRCRNWDYHKPWTYLMTLSCQHHEVVPMPQAASLPEGWQYPKWLRDAYANPGRPHLFGELAGEREEDAHIVLFPQGIPSDMRNKAGFGPYFDACANGQLLILSPWEYGKPSTARMQHAAGSVMSSQPPAASTPMRPSQSAAASTPTRPARSTKLQRWQCLFLNDLAAQLAVGVEILGASSPNPPKAAPR